MLNALEAKTVLRIVGIVVISLIALSMFALKLLDPAQADASIWALLLEAGKLSLVLVGLLFALVSWGPAFRLIHFLTFAHHWLFPWIGGEWRGEVRSNWPRVEAMMKAARRETPPFDTFRDELPPAEPIKVKAQIKCRLMSLHIRFEMVGTDRTSETIFVRPVKTPEGKRQLYYVYKQDDLGAPPVTDRRDHVGAAELTWNEGHTLQGRYWTARNEERGLNTAGVLNLKRVKAPKKGVVLLMSKIRWPWPKKKRA